MYHISFNKFNDTNQLKISLFIKNKTIEMTSNIVINIQ